MSYDGFLKNVISAATATMVAEVSTLPICTTKTMYQTTNHKLLHVVRNIYSQYGIRGFFHGSLPAITSQIITTTCKYSLYQLLEEKKYKYSCKELNGIISGITVSLFTHPFDVIKNHLQKKVSLATYYRIHGIKIFYRGYSKSFGKTILGSALFFPLYSRITEFLKSTNQNDRYIPLMASAISAIVSTTFVHPIDYAKTLHILRDTHNFKFRFRDMFKGLHLNLMRVVPHFMIVMSGTELMKYFLS